MDVRIDVQTEAFKKDLNFFTRDQYPYAMAKTLTDLAKSGQVAVRQRTRAEFDLHTDFIPNNIGMVPARKSDVLLGKAMSAVKTNEKIAFMTPHETGENKVPKRTALSVPSILAKRIPDFKTATGKVKAKYQPKQLLAQKGGGKVAGFVADGTLFARLKDKWRTGSRIIPVFGFTPKAKIKPVWRFAITVGAKVTANAAAYFNRNLKAAMATRKP